MKHTVCTTYHIPQTIMSETTSPTLKDMIQENSERVELLKEAPLASDSVSAKPHIPSITASAVLGESESMPEGTPIVQGHDFQSNNETNQSSQLLDAIMSSYSNMGFQASNLALAIDSNRSKCERTSELESSLASPPIKYHAVRGKSSDTSFSIKWLMSLSPLREESRRI